METKTWRFSIFKHRFHRRISPKSVSPSALPSTISADDLPNSFDALASSLNLSAPNRCCSPYNTNQSRPSQFSNHDLLLIFSHCRCQATIGTFRKIGDRAHHYCGYDLIPFSFTVLFSYCVRFYSAPYLCKYEIILIPNHLTSCPIE